MPTNAELAERLDALAALLDLAGASPYAQRAYRRAAELIRATPASVAELVRAGRARELRGIGPGIEARLRELVETGRLVELDELEHELLPQLVAVGRLAGVGAYRMAGIGRSLGLRTADELRDAAAGGRLRAVPGIGPETERKLVDALTRPQAPRASRGLLLDRGRALVGEIAAALGGEPAGDPRRFRDLCEHLAVVRAAERPEPVLERFEALAQLVAIVERSERRAVGVTVDGVPVELHVPPPHALGTALVRATGSHAYVAALEPLPEAATEEAVYAALGLPWCPPELREQPRVLEPVALLELADVRGDLHCHTTWSDGRLTVAELGEAARARGYEYVAVCDHTPAVHVVPGLDADGLRRQAEEIAEANERLAPFRILRGAECDILRDGTLDLPDDVLEELDWVQASVHAGQRTPARALTLRVEEALRHPAVSCLSHPKGRIIGHRPENALDLDRVVEVCRETGVALEVNGLPDRLDLRGELVHVALAAGVPIVCSTDAHSERGLGNMLLAVGTARRGGATAGDVVNTRPLPGLLARRRC